MIRIEFGERDWSWNEHDDNEHVGKKWIESETHCDSVIVSSTNWIIGFAFAFML